MKNILYILKQFSIFSYIEFLSHKLAHKISDKNDKDDVEFWEYWCYVLLSTIFDLIVGLIPAIILGYWIPFLIIAVLFAIIRTKIGGYHSKSFDSCFGVTEIMFAIGSLLAKTTIKYIIPMFLISTLGAFFITPYIPKPSHNTPERSELKKVYFRKVYRNRFLFAYVLNVILIYLIYRYGYNLGIYSTSISSAIILVVIIMSNTGERIIEEITNWCKRLFKTKS